MKQNRHINKIAVIGSGIMVSRIACHFANVVVEVFPYHLDIARVRTIRNESFISGLIGTIELKTDADGKYID